MERENNIYFARLAEQGERYEDMINYMKIVAKVSLMPITHLQSGAQLSNEERNLLSVAFKNSVGTRRAAWRTVSAIQDKEEYKASGKNEKYLDLIKWYRQKIETELN